MADYINTIDSLKKVDLSINLKLILLITLGMIIAIKIVDRPARSKAEENRQTWIAFIGSMAGLSIVLYILIECIIWVSACSTYDKAYQDGLYNHYSEYKDNIKSVSIPEDKSYKFNLVVNVDNTDYTITLDKYANNYEEVDTQDSEESYYELFRDTKNKKIRIRKYVGSSEYDKMTSNTFKEK